MSKFLRMLLAVIVGFVLGSIVNMALIMVSGQIIPPPAGANVTTMEGLKASLHLFEAKHFIFPFLAHAMGTLVGALVAFLLAPAKSPVPAYVVGALFLLGGIANTFLLPAPARFIAADLLLAYLPSAWLGLVLAKRISSGGASGA
ncbi:MAG: hypothetical protein IPP44_00510 [Ideonella sp.]|nr:hypothetical protein [Ideonella sp.]MBL0085190.1 hypothetical protein [Ideonella sp.]